MSASARTLIAAIKAVHFPSPPKIIFNSSQGTGSSLAKMPLLMRMLFNYSTMRVGLDDHNRVDTLAKESGLPFVMARPTRLAEGPAKDVKVWTECGKGVPMMATITRESLGEWLVEAAEKKEWDGTMPVLTN